MRIGENEGKREMGGEVKKKTYLNSPTKALTAERVIKNNHSASVLRFANQSPSKFVSVRAEQSRGEGGGEGASLGDRGSDTESLKRCMFIRNSSPVRAVQRLSDGHGNF